MKNFVDDKMESWGPWIVDHPFKVMTVNSIVAGLLIGFGLWTWVLWAYILIAQNFAFTYVSRARNSGSLSRHMKAAFMSNGTWWLSQVIIFSTLFNYMTGKGGIPAMLATGLFYSVFTMAGSLIAHAQALRNECGMEAVGANKKLAQITAEDWDRVKKAVFSDTPPDFPAPLTKKAILEFMRRDVRNYK